MRRRGKCLNNGKHPDVSWPRAPWVCPGCGETVRPDAIVATITSEDAKDDTFLCVPCDLVHFWLSDGIRGSMV